jgi:hypothetical protein
MSQGKSIMTYMPQSLRLTIGRIGQAFIRMRSIGRPSNLNASIASRSVGDPRVSLAPYVRVFGAMVRNSRLEIAQKAPENGLFLRVAHHLLIRNRANE